MLQQIIDEHRGTGKTTRMLIEAIKSANEGLKTVVIAKNDFHAGQLLQHIDCLTEGKCPLNLKIKIIRDCHIAHKVFKTSVEGGYQKLYFDHYTLEEEFKNLLNETFKYYEKYCDYGLEKINREKENDKK